MVALSNSHVIGNSAALKQPSRDLKSIRDIGLVECKKSYSNY